jgi:3-phosphoshikimate 1-carboxyvinyltransferase
MALPLVSQDSEITVEDLHERPYMEMTLHWLDQQNIAYTHQRIQNRDIYKISGRQTYKPFDTNISGDFSSASYLIAAAALLEGSVELQGLEMNDPQGDKRLVTLLQEMGADIRVEPTRLLIRGGKPLKGIKIDANDIPDLLPTLAVIGTQAEGKTEICHVAQARIKETDRIHSMTEGLRRLGANIEEYPDGMVVYQGKLQGGRVKGYGDHRTVMALGVAGLLSTDKTIVEDCEAINKTFPNFIEIMQSLGARMEASREE